MPEGFTAVSAVFTVNATTANIQSSADVIYLPGATAGMGVFGVAYNSDDPVDFNSDILYREVNLDGSFASAEQVIVAAPAQQISPDLVRLEGGQVVVAWWDVSRTAADSEFVARIGSGDGTTTLANFGAATISLATGFDVSDRIGDMIALGSGGFALGAAFSSPGVNEQAFVGVYGPDGVAVATPDRINDGSFRSSFEGLAELPDGRVLTLIETRSDFPFVTTGELRAYTAAGVPSGGNVTLRYPDSYVYDRSLTTLEDGRILETYTTQNFDGSTPIFDVAGRIVAPSGDVMAAFGPLGDVAGNDDKFAVVAATPDGGFVVLWRSGLRGEGVELSQLVIRRFDIDGEPTGASQVVAASLQGEQTLTVSPQGEVFVTWTSVDPMGGIDYDIEARTYTLDELGTPGVTRGGTSGNDRLFGTSDDDTIMGGDGADLLDGGAGHDVMAGGLGNDFYIVDSLGDQITGEVAYAAGGGIDTVRTFVSYVQPDNIELVRLGNLEDRDRLTAVGNDAPGTLVGNAGGNILIGRGGNDQLNGNGGWDKLVGGVGRDTLVGGSGRDTFVYNSISESRVGISERDVINGFDRGLDRIDLSAMDANLGLPGDAAFEFIGTARFSGTAGELRLQGLGGPNAVIVEGDLRGDGVADFQVFVNLTTVLGADDFLL